MKANDPTLAKVKLSFRISMFAFRVAVAGVPVAEAVTARVWRGRMLVGVPMIVVVLPEVADKDNPVPVNTGADH